jgi:NAD(P)-dependent dehydrogenase (short-subunit alcohol dehydrogenase family)
VLAAGRNQVRLAELCNNTEGITPLLVDLGSPESLELMLDQLLAKRKYIPYVINNAGTMVSANLTKLSLEDLRMSLMVNALSPFRIMQRVLPGMEENNFGRIINITSGAPLNCFAGYTAYNASKGALNIITVTAAREYSQKNIKINLMSPGPVRSNMTPKAAMDPEVCHPTLDFLLNLDEKGPTGRFFWLGWELPLFPDLKGIEWLEGKAVDSFPRILS